MCDTHAIPAEDHRETARWLREIAGECRIAGEREEFMRLAELFDRRADQLDRRSHSHMEIPGSQAKRESPDDAIRAHPSAARDGSAPA